MNDAKNIKTTFASRLRFFRERARLTQKELAGKLGVALITVSQYETGAREPNFEKTIAIADFFDIPLDELFGRSTHFEYEYKKKSLKKPNN